MLTLRPDQIKATEDLRQAIREGKRAPLLQASTGWGKTVWFSSLTRTAIEKGKRVLILCHREELVDQISQTLNEFDVDHSFISARYGYNPLCKVQVCSVFTLINRLHKIPKPDLIICDEAHHTIRTSTWGKILLHFNDVLRIGVTATPRRTSGEPLSDLFDCLIKGPSPRWLMDERILSDYRLFAPTSVDLTDVHKRGGDYAKNELSDVMDRPTIIGDAVATYRQHASGKRAVAFCVSIQHAHHTAEAFSAAGYKSLPLDGELDPVERRKRVALFRLGEIQVLTSCDILNEGFDVKGIEVGIFLRPTQSLTLWLQQLGRCLRSMPGKDYALLFDHANNAMTHGLPDDEREWSLDGFEKSKTKEKPKTPVKQCRSCYAVVPLGQKACKWCQTVFEIKPREVEQQEGELRELSAEELQRRAARREQGMASTYEALLRIEKQRGYKPGWARIIWNAKRSRRTAKQDGALGNSAAKGLKERFGGTLFELASAFRPKK